MQSAHRNATSIDTKTLGIEETVNKYIPKTWGTRINRMPHLFYEYNWLCYQLVFAITPAKPLPACKRSRQ